MLLIKGIIWHFDSSNQLKQLDPGYLVINDQGFIADLGEGERFFQQYANLQLLDYGACLILPGFIDAHLHFPQFEIIGSYGEDLIGWLNRYTFPAEAAYENNELAEKNATRFFYELLANGVTTAGIFSSSHYQATDILFNEAQVKGIRAIIGKVSMDQNAPEKLLSNLDDDRLHTERLIARWHKKNERLFYALTPRFAPSCGQMLLSQLGEIYRTDPSLYIQTHLSESPAEIAWARELHPYAKDYLDIYEQAGLLTQKSIFAHCIYLNKHEFTRLQDYGAGIVHCPSSNLFLGSGLFQRQQWHSLDSNICLGTDIGAGTSFSMWKTMLNAYEIQRLQNQTIAPEALFYGATLGGARAFKLDDVTGNLIVDKSADFQVIDLTQSRLLSQRFSKESSLREKLFALISLADDRLVRAVFVQGKSIYQQN